MIRCTQDACAAMAYGPEQKGECAWPAAHIMKMLALKAAQKNTEALFHAMKAIDMRAEVPSGCSDVVEQLLQQVPDACKAAALQVTQDSTAECVCWVIKMKQALMMTNLMPPVRYWKLVGAEVSMPAFRQKC